jgi:sirohydrochlorin cobaltochelatase
MHKPALILFGHGARDPEWAVPLIAVRHRIQAARPALAVELAFLEFLTPDLPTTIAGLVDAGFADLAILPLFIAPGGHLKRELPELVARLARQHPAIRLRLLPAIGLVDTVQAAMAEAALAALSAP